MRKSSPWYICLSLKAGVLLRHPSVALRFRSRRPNAVPATARKNKSRREENMMQGDQRKSFDLKSGRRRPHSGSEKQGGGKGRPVTTRTTRCWVSNKRQKGGNRIVIVTHTVLHCSSCGGEQWKRRNQYTCHQKCLFRAKSSSNSSNSSRRLMVHYTRDSLVGSVLIIGKCLTSMM